MDDTPVSPSHTTQEITVEYDGGKYTCRRKRSDSQHSLKSDPPSLSVSEKPKAVITSSLKGDVLTENSVTLTCTLTPQSTGWTFYWIKDGRNLETETKTNSYTIRPVGESNRGGYKCRAGRGDPVYYTHYSNDLQLDVTENTKPVITSGLIGAALSGNPVTLTCRLDLQSNGWKIYWTTPTQSTETETKTQYYRSSSYPYYYSSYSNYTISSVSVSDGGQYRCRAGRGTPVYYTLYSNLSLSVIESPKPVVIIRPDKQVFWGERVTFKCDIQTGGNTEWTYEWYRDGHTFSPYSTAQEFTGGKYTCRGRRSDSQLSQISHPVTLSVSEKPKAELTSNLKGAALTGNSVTLTCRLNVQSDGWTFSYFKGSHNLRTDPVTNDYIIRSVSESSRGKYKCRAGRGDPVYYTHDSNELPLVVTESPKPVVIIRPDTQVFSGERVTFRCDIDGGGTTGWTYDWYRDDHTFYPYSTAQEFTDYYYSSGKYTCRGRRSDSQLSLISDPVTLSVSEKPKPTVSVNPLSSISTEDKVTLSCDLEGTGWTFVWYKGQRSVEGHSKTLDVTVSNVGKTATYYCEASRGTYKSYSSDSVKITARPKPALTVHPAESVFIEESVTLTCGIQIKGSWQYHWYRDNNKLSDAAGEKTHTITDVKESNEGDYTCKGTKSSDPEYTEITLTSDAVRLTVSEKPKPDLTSDPKGETLTGNSVTLTCTLKLQSAGWKFYWITPTQSNETETAAISDNSSSSYYSHYNITPVNVSDGGQYKCRAGRGTPVYYTHYSDALWVNVTVSDSKPSGLIEGLSSTFTLFFLMILLIVLVRYKKKKDDECQTPSAVILDTSEPADAAAEPSDVTYAEIELKKIKKPKKKPGKSSKGDETVYSELKQDTDKDAAAGPSDVTYAETVLKKLKKPKKKPGKSSKGDETVYSELKQDTDKGKSSEGDDNLYSEVKNNTDKDAAAGPSDVKCVKPEPIKPKKKLFSLFKGKSSEGDDNLYSEVKNNTDEDSAAGPSDVTCVKPEPIKPKKKLFFSFKGKRSEGDDNLYSEVKNSTDKDVAPGPSDVTCFKPQLMQKPKKNQGKSSEGDDNLYSEVKKNTDKDAAPGLSDVTCVKPELMKKPKKNEGKSSEGDDNLYSEVKKKTDKDAAPGLSHVTCVKPELMKKPKTNQDAAPGPSNVPYAKTELKKLNPGKSSDGAGDMFSELKRAMEKKSQMSPKN